MCFALKYIELAEGNGVFLYRLLASGTKEQPQFFCSSTSDQLNWRARRAPATRTKRWKTGSVRASAPPPTVRSTLRARWLRHASQSNNATRTSAPWRLPTVYTPTLGWAPTRGPVAKRGPAPGPNRGLERREGPRGGEATPSALALCEAWRPRQVARSATGPERTSKASKRMAEDLSHSFGFEARRSLRFGTLRA